MIHLNQNLKKNRTQMQIDFFWVELSYVILRINFSINDIDNLNTVLKGGVFLSGV